MISDKNNAEKYAKKLNIEKHFEYLPLIFLHRTRDSKKRIGDPITVEERKYLREKDLANFTSIN